MEIALHLGAHKTATTYLQTRLTHSRGILQQQGIAYVPLRALRDGMTARLWKVMRPGIAGYLAGREFRLSVEAELEAAARTEAWRLVLSDENLLGTCGEMVTHGTFYPRAWGALEHLAHQLREHPVWIYLSVRDYADFFPSAYGQVIRHGRYQPFDRQMKERIARLARGWPELIGDIRAAFPDARIRVWAYEDLAMLEPMLFAEMLGPQAARGLCALDERPLRGLSDRAVAMIAAAQGGPAADGVVARAIRAFPKSDTHPAFDPWSPGERAALSARYHRDLAVIRQAFPGVLRQVAEAA